MNTSDIRTNIDNPRELEKLYRENKAAFKTEFNSLYPQLTDHKLAGYWNERLNFETPEINWGSRNEIIFVIITALLAGIIAKLPAFLDIDPELFYQRNIGFIVFPVLTFYFIRRNNFPLKTILFAGLVTLIASVFINLLPANDKSDTLLLSCIHLPLLLWSVMGISYTGDRVKDHEKRIEFLKFNGDLVIMSTIMVISGAILTAITIGLFGVIGFDIEKFYTEYIGIFGLAAVPVVGTYIVQTNPQLVNKVSPVIARIFSPLVLIMLVVYLVAMFFSGKDPYKDRDFLMIFNLLLIGVMAIILFSVAGTINKNLSRAGSSILLALSTVTIIVNGIALSAILFRISEWGMTPNRLAILGANLLMLANLLMVTFRLFKYVFKKSASSDVASAISMFLPVYLLWSILVTFVFPFIFQFR